MGFLQRLLGFGQPTHQVQVNFGGKVANHPAMNPQQIQAANAQIEADGARMYNQAHPGQVYRTNQNNEFQPGQLPTHMPFGQPNYLGYRAPQQNPTLSMPQPRPVVGFAPRTVGNFQPNINVQGIQNPGLTPMQGSVGVRPIQGDY